MSAAIVLKHANNSFDGDCASCLYYGEVQSMEYRIGSGIQVSFFKKKEFIYSYLDLNYRRHHEFGSITANSNGVVYVPSQYNYNMIVNGLDAIIGIGTKLKLYKNIYFSAEVGYDLLFANNTKNLAGTRVKENEVIKNKVGKMYISMMF